ncbi:MAG: hypothetical protein JW795_05650 [Chitinivibrionales bacterium]|nr:hypothetical protein [Chitinivibrionales bacterium]
MATNQTQLINILTQSYQSQIQVYAELNALMDKILGHLVLSRNDVAGVMVLFEQEKSLIERLSALRSHIQPSIDQWQTCKHDFGQTPEAQELQSLFDEAEKQIRHFLQTQEQIRLRLEFAQQAGSKQQPANHTEPERIR